MIQNIQGISLIIAFVLMPFLCKREPWPIRLVYLILMCLFTPILGYPLYRYFVTH